MTDSTMPRARIAVGWFRTSFAASRRDAILTWTADDRLRLEQVDPQGMPTEPVFDAPIPEIGVAPSPGQLVVRVDGRRHVVEFSSHARRSTMIGAAAGGLVGALVANAIAAGPDKDGGAGQWMAALLAAGATRVSRNSARTIAVTCALVVACVALIVAFVATR